MLLYAFVGGLILNVMPCVLPVIALKILGFVAQAKDEPRQIRKLGLIYGAGVLFSFLLLAALVVGDRRRVTKRVGACNLPAHISSLCLPCWSLWWR